MREKELIKRYESLLIENNYLLKSSVVQDEQIKAYRFRIGELEFENQCLKETLKDAKIEPKTDWQKTLIETLDRM